PECHSALLHESLRKAVSTFAETASNSVGLSRLRRPALESDERRHSGGEAVDRRDLRLSGLQHPLAAEIRPEVNGAPDLVCQRGGEQGALVEAERVVEPALHVLAQV